ncbi:MAG: MogA/MoaB family molybdenum cofactor biosynthesis protein [Cyanobacteria bacterium P01_D01_bin.73]
MTSQPHPDSASSTVIALNCAVLTVSDTRTPETDKSGQLAQDRLQAAGHAIAHYVILPDEPDRIASTVRGWSADHGVDVVILSGGTGIAPRDTTYEAIATLLHKTIPGFGELFRSLSYQEIGSRAMTSRAIAGIINRTLVFSLPGSSNAVRLALDALILPELRHLHRLLNPESD